jgi:hypothetical protein
MESKENGVEVDEMAVKWHTCSWSWEYVIDKIQE